MNASTQVKTVLLIAIASVFATGMELAGIDSLAAPREPIARQAVVQLPTVFVTAQRDTQAQAQTVAAVQQLPRMVIVGHRDALTAAAQATRTASEI